MLDQTNPGALRPSSGEAPFDIEQVFFSRTDERGVIKAFNDVFCTVADYPAAEILNAPHKIIRHPDMPRAVFWLLWDTIKAGRPVGAYVKNRARDGLYYWVFAVVTPIDGGFVSVRLKPTSGLLAKVQSEYARLLKREADQGLTPEQSAGELLERLCALGYRSYGQFQAEALAAETTKRDEALGRRADSRIERLTSIQKQLSTMRTANGELARHFEAIGAIPNNLRIMASRIEPSGGPITAISANYKSMSQDVVQQLREFANTCGERQKLGSNVEEDGLFILCASRLMSDVVQHFAEEAECSDAPDTAEETKTLTDLDKRYRESANASVKRVLKMADDLSQESEDLRRMVVGLDSIRVMCRVESGRMGHQYDGLASIIESLDKFHSLIDAKLDEIGTKAKSINKDASDLLRAWNTY